MDVFGAIANAIDLAEKARQYLQNFKEEATERLKLSEEVTTLTTLLPLVRSRIEDAKRSQDQDYQAALTALGSSGGPLQHFILSLDALNKRLEKATQGPLQRTAQRLLWPTTLSNIKDELAKIERFKTLVTVILGSHSLRAFLDEIQTDLTGIAEDMSELKAGMKDLQVAQNAYLSQSAGLHRFLADALSKMKDDDRRRLANSLSPTMLSSIPPTITATEGTGKLFLESPEFNAWERGDVQLLWCPGNAGCGKTSLMTVVIPHLQQTCLNDPSRQTINFYFNYNSSPKISVPLLLAYLLKELLQIRGLSSTTDLLESHRLNASTSSDSEILTMLQAEILTYKQVFIVFDALDEAPENARLNIIKRLLADLPANTSYLFTFRDLPEITNTFQGRGQRLDIVAHDQDLRTYINSVFQDNDKLTRLAERGIGKDEIRSKVIEKADGMFLMVRLMMDQLSAQKTPKGLLAALDHLPSSLNEMYDQTLDRCPDREIALRLLSWILLAERPLSVDEVRHAVAWLMESEGPLDEDDLEDEESLLSSCSGLVTVRQEIRSETVPWQNAEYTAVVLIHYTTQEYFSKLVSPHLLTHVDITLLSLHYLNHHLTPEAIVSKPPLLEYCAHNWPNHALRCTENTEVTAASLAFVEDRARMDVLCLFEGLPVGRSALHFSCGEGLYHLIHHICTNDPESLNSVWNGTPPLHLANDRRVSEAILSQDGVDINARNIRGQTALFVALKDAYKTEIIDQLVASKDVQLNACDDYGQTILTSMVTRGVWEYPSGMERLKFVIELEGFDLNAKDWAGRTALHHAARMGAMSLFQMLLAQPSVVINLKDMDGQTPLHVAAYHGHLNVVEAFLEREDVDTNSLNHNDASALHMAAKAGHSDVIRALVARPEVAVNAKNVIGWTPLIWAAKEGRISALRTLLQVEDADANLVDDFGKKALDYALERYAPWRNKEDYNSVILSLRQNRRHSASVDGTSTPPYLSADLPSTLQLGDKRERRDDWRVPVTV